MKKLAEEFQANVVKVMLARKELNEENQVITAKSLEGTKKKKRANKPNEFITNDDFCPGCGLRLKNMPEDENNFWTEIFQRELKDADDPAAMIAAGGRGGKARRPVVPWLGPGEPRGRRKRRRSMASVKADMDEARKKLDPAYPFMHGVEDAAEAGRSAAGAFAAIRRISDAEVPRHFLSMLSTGDPSSVPARAAGAWNWRTIS